MSPFTYQDGIYRALWDPYEIVAFGTMIRAAMETIKSGKPVDPVRQKLLPPLSKDSTVAAEFQRLAGSQIQDAKLKNLQELGLLLVANLPTHDNGELVEVTILESDVQPALQALTALRVFLGAKLEIETDEDSEILFNLLQNATENFEETHTNVAREQQMYLASVFFAAGFVQETLLAALTGRH